MPCPAHMLGYLYAIRLAQTARRCRCLCSGRLAFQAGAFRFTPSFRAKCPAPLVLREAPGYKIGLPGRRLVEPGRFVEESLLNSPRGSIPMRREALSLCCFPQVREKQAFKFLDLGNRRR